MSPSRISRSFASQCRKTEFGPDATIEGYAMRRTPFCAQYPSSACWTSNSYRPGAAAFIARTCPRPVISVARRMRAISSVSLTTRSS